MAITLEVGSDKTYKTLQEAVNAASVTEENIIIVSEGTYDEDITLDSRYMEQKANITFAAAEGETVKFAGLFTIGYYEKRVGAKKWEADVAFKNIIFDQTSAQKHSIDIQQCNDFALTDCTIIGDVEYGILGTNVDEGATITGCTFENAGIQSAGSFGTDLLIDDCTFNESRVNIQSGNSVTIQDCTFDCTVTDANVGDSFYCIRSNDNSIDIKGCTFDIDSTLTAPAAEQAKWGILWQRSAGGTKWTAEDIEVNLTDAAMAQDELLFNKNGTTTAANEAGRITIKGLSSTSNDVADLMAKSEGMLNASADGVSYVLDDGVVQSKTAANQIAVSADVAGKENGEIIVIGGFSYEVGKTAFSTINAALTEAKKSPEKVVIEIAAGEYTENVNFGPRTFVENGITYVGGITFKAVEGADVKINGYFQCNGVLGDLKDIAFDGLTITNSVRNGGYFAPIMFGDNYTGKTASGIVVTNCTLNSTANGGTSSGVALAMGLVCDGITISNNTINADCGVYGGDGNLIKNTVISENTMNGNEAVPSYSYWGVVYIYNSGAGNEVSGNTISGSALKAVKVNKGNGIVLTDNTVTNCGDITFTDGSVVSGNTVDGIELVFPAYSGSDLAVMSGIAGADGATVIIDDQAYTVGQNVFEDMSNAMAKVTADETNINIYKDVELTGKTGVFNGWGNDAGQVALYDLGTKTVNWKAADGESALLDVSARHIVLHGTGTLNIDKSVTIDYRQAAGAGLGESLFAVGSFWVGDDSTDKPTVNLDGKIIVGDVELAGDNGSVKVRHGQLNVTENGSIDADYSIRVRDGILNVTGSGKDAETAQLKSQRLELNGDASGAAKAVINDSYVSITYGSGRIADRFDNNAADGYAKSFEFNNSRVEADSLSLIDTVTTFNGNNSDFTFDNAANSGTIKLADSTLNVSGTLTNNGNISVAGESNIAAAVMGNGWMNMDSAEMGAETEIDGGNVRFVNGTSTLDGAFIDAKAFQVGLGGYQLKDERENVTDVIVNVTNGSFIGAVDIDYNGWIGTGYFDTDADKAAAMTDAKYILNVDKSNANFGYLHISNDGVLNVTGNAEEMQSYTGVDHSFYGGRFIVNGAATFDNVDALVLFTNVSCDNGTDEAGKLVIKNGANYVSYRDSSTSDISVQINKKGVIEVDNATFDSRHGTSIAAEATLSVKNAGLFKGYVVTNNGTIAVDGGNLDITALTNSGAINFNGGVLNVGNVDNQGTVNVKGTGTINATVTGNAVNVASNAVVNGVLNADLLLKGDATVNADFSGAITGKKKVFITEDKTFNLAAEGNAISEIVVSDGIIFGEGESLSDVAIKGKTKEAVVTIADSLLKGNKFSNGKLAIINDEGDNFIAVNTDLALVSKIDGFDVVSVGGLYCYVDGEGVTQVLTKTDKGIEISNSVDENGGNTEAAVVLKTLNVKDSSEALKDVNVEMAAGTATVNISGKKDQKTVFKIGSILKSDLGGVTNLNIGSNTDVSVNGKVDSLGNLIVSNNAALSVKDAITGKNSNQSIKIGSDSKADFAEIDLLGGKNSFSVASRSKVTAKTLTNISALSLSNGKGAEEENMTTMTVNGDYVAAGSNNSIALGNYAKLTITGMVDNGGSASGSGTSFKIGNDSYVDITGSVNGLISLKLGKNAGFKSASIEGTDESDKITVGAGATLNTGDIALSGGKNSMTVSKGAAVIAGDISGLNKLNTSSGAKEAVTTVEGTSLSGTTTNDTVAFGNWNNVLIGERLANGEITGGDVDLFDGNDTLKIGNDSVVRLGVLDFGENVDGKDDKDALTLGSNVKLTVSDILNVETVKVGKNTTITKSNGGGFDFDEVSGNWTGATLVNDETFASGETFEGLLYGNEYAEFDFNIASGENMSLDIEGENTIVELFQGNELVGSYGYQDLAYEIADLNGDCTFRVSVAGADFNKATESDNRYMFKATIA